MCGLENEYFYLTQTWDLSDGAMDVPISGNTEYFLTMKVLSSV